MKNTGDILINTSSNYLFHKTKAVFEEGIIWAFWVLFSLFAAPMHDLSGSVWDKGLNKLTKPGTKPSCT